MAGRQAYVSGRIVRGTLSRWVRVEISGVCESENPCGTFWLGEVDESLSAEEWREILDGLVSTLCWECWESLDRRRLERWGQVLSRESKR